VPDVEKTAEPEALVFMLQIIGIEDQSLEKPRPLL
jgi:hypothetical protein